MTDKEDNKNDKKSTVPLKAIQGTGVAAVPVKNPNEKRKYRDIHAYVASAMSGKPWGWQPFPVKLHRVVDIRGENLAYCENKNRIVKNVSDAYLNAAIADYWNNTLACGDRPIFLGAISASDCDKIRKLWFAISPAVKKPFPLVTWASDPRPSHHKLSFDPLPIDQLTGAAPLCNELLSRMSNARALMAWLGSIMDEKSQRQQYIWLHGKGENGKGALIRALESVMGPVMANEQAPSGDAKHWTWGLLGKRLVVFADCNNASFITSGLFKSLTGEDKVRVEIKGGAILSLDIPAKYFFSSNNKPRVSSSPADMRRIIFCHIQPIPSESFVEDYEDKMLVEMPAFLSACWHQYILLTKGKPRARIVPEDEDELTNLVGDTEHEFAAFVDHYLCFDRDEKGFWVDERPLMPAHTKPFTRPGELMETMISAGFRDDYKRGQLRDYLECKHKLVCTTHRVEPRPDGTFSGRKVFLGVKILRSP